MNTIIETKSLTRRFGSQEVVCDVTLQVPEGCVYAFLGANGAGKTTTIQMLLNMIEPTRGSSSVLGVDTSRLGPREWQQIGYVSENQQLPDWMTTQQLINYCAPMYPNWDKAFCDKLVKDFDLPVNRKIKQLSRGMKMKVSLLSSLAYRPKLLVLDEPFTGLDPLARDEFVRGVLELADEKNWTIFISSHDIEEVERLADWVGILHNGRLQLSASAVELQSKFQQIDVTLADAPGKLPPGLPTSWLVPEVAGTLLRFVDSEFSSLPQTETRLRQALPGAVTVTSSPMSLRTIFLAMARTFRFSGNPQN